MLSVVWFLFVALTVASAVVDLLTYRIPNLLVLAVAALFLLVALINFNSIGLNELFIHIGVSILVLGGGIILYAVRQLGAGDAKFLAALALWAGISGIVPLLFFVSLSGLFGMLVIVLLRIVVPRLQPSLAEKGSLPRVLKRGQGIPYALGLGPGAIIASFYFSRALWPF